MCVLYTQSPIASAIGTFPSSQCRDYTIRQRYLERCCWWCLSPSALFRQLQSEWIASIPKEKKTKISGVQCEVFSINGNMNVIAELCYAGWLYAAEGNLTHQNFASLPSPRLKVWSDACSTRKIIKWRQQTPLRTQSSIRQATAKTSPRCQGKQTVGLWFPTDFPSP